MNKYIHHFKHSHDQANSYKNKKASQKRNKQRFQEKISFKYSNQSMSTSGDQAIERGSFNHIKQYQYCQRKTSYVQKNKSQSQQLEHLKFYASKDQIQNQEIQVNYYSSSEYPEQKQKKVELCRNFLDTGYCYFKYRCKFAHGIEQLLQNEDLMTTFKTKKCKTFYDHKNCRFGQRCNFKHDDRQLQQIFCSEKKKKNQKRSKFLENYPELLLELKQESRMSKILA